MEYDYHVHSTYSDGSDVGEMVDAASEAGLAGIGFADHCTVATEGPGTERPDEFPETYLDRRREIERYRTAADIDVFDAVEMDYAPSLESDIAAFLAETDFDYAVGSVHHVRGRGVMVPGGFADDSAAERAAVVDAYVDRLVSLVESDLFEVAAHVDVTERNPALRGLVTEDHYEAIARAFADADTVPELNAGRVFRGPREVHPHPDLLETLLEAGVDFVTGTDSHTPAEIGDRAAYLDDLLAEYDIDPLTI